MSRHDYSPDKLGELFLYIARKTRDAGSPGLGRVRVAKLMFLADFGAFLRLGHAITGAQYWADKYGPSPSDEMLLTRDLEAAGRLHWEPGYDRQRIPNPVGPIDVSVFSDEEMRYIDSIIDRYSQFTAQELVDVAHDFPGWKFAWEREGPNTPIPYEAAFWSPRTELRSEEQAYASHLAEEFGLV